MHRRAAALLVSACLLCPCAVPALAAEKTPGKALAAVRAPSKQAQALRQQSDLVPYAPAKEVLDAFFTADEDAPKFVWGPVAAYAKARKCPTAWLIEKGELARIERLQAKKDGQPFEFSLTLEEDCKGVTVTRAVFVAATGGTPESWLKWRSQFHGRKAEAHYGAAAAGLKKAAAAGLAPTAELRFLSVNGELVLAGRDQVLQNEGRLAPVFDLDKGERPGR